MTTYNLIMSIYSVLGKNAGEVTTKNAMGNLESENKIKGITVIAKKLEVAWSRK